jgi:hypothetical protein
MTTQRFIAQIKKSGTRTLITIPFNPNDVWGVKQHHYVSGTVNGFTIRASLGSDGTQFFLPIGSTWRRDNHLDVGNSVEVVLSPEGPQSELLASDIAAALAGVPEAREFFDGLATFYRKNYLRWIESAKRPETRAARIEEMIQLLKAGKRQK